MSHFSSIIYAFSRRYDVFWIFYREHTCISRQIPFV